MAAKRQRKSSIKFKLVAGFVACVLITAAVGGVSIWANIRSKVAVEEELGHAAETKDTAYVMEIDLLQARRAEKNYLERLDWTYVEGVQESIALVESGAEWLAANNRSEEGRATGLEALALAEEYELTFMDVADSIQQRGHGDLGIIGEFRAKAREIEAVFQQYQNDVLERNLLMVRRSEKNYLLDGDEHEVQATADAAAVLLVSVGSSTVPRSVVTQVEALVGEYLVLFNRVVSLDTEIAAYTETFIETVRLIEPLIAGVVADVEVEWENSIAAYEQLLTSTMVIVIILVVMGVVVSLTLGLVLATKISKPLVASVAVADAIAVGDLTVEIADARTRDEVGQLVESFKEMTTSLNDTLGQVDEAVDQVNTGSEQVAQASQSLSQGSTEQASSLEEITASLNEINSQSNQNSEAASEASSVAKGSLQSATNGNEEMQALISAMGQINNSSDEISKVVKVIDDIAFQINLLALNANVEAARAGKYGKGFAVVADEVRNLAVRSADAAKETTAMVNETTRNVGAGNKAAEATSTQLEEIVSSSTKVADFLEEIALASKEQAQGIEQINQGLSQIDQVTQSNTANAEESAAAAEELAAQAQQLRALVARFQLAGRQNGNHAAQPVRPALTAKGSNGNGRKATEPKEASAAVREPVAAGARAETRTANPKDVIKLDDDDFGKF